MKELSVFIDESGDFGEYDDQAPYYIITMVFHDQSQAITDAVQKGQLFTPIYPYRSSQKGKGTVQDHMYSLWRLSDKIIFREIFWSLNAETHPVFDEEFLF